MTCYNCGTQHEAGFCPNCGAPAEVTCTTCGTKHQAKFCPGCGAASVEPTAQQPAQPQQPAAIPNIIINNTNTNTNTNVNGIGNGISPKSKMVALILCVIAGLIGAHRFYVGKVGSGALYLFTFGLFGIGWVYDIIKIATGTFRDGAGLIISQ